MQKVRSKDDRINGELVLPDIHALDNNATTRRVPNKHIIPVDRITVIRELGTGEFGVVQQGIWTSDEGRVRYIIKLYLCFFTIRCYYSFNSYIFLSPAFK